MCGITGFVTPSPHAAAEEMEATVLRMADALRHRGPDDSGSWVNASCGVALGHRRLSVVDLSPLGHQPMHSASGRYVIVFNGEIYNFRALRAELEQRGHIFRGHSDTEVMLAAITEWGVRDAVTRFNGMFAFALWDQQEHALSLARDRFGEKPFYYGWFGGIFMFASELKALRAHPRFEATIDRDSLALYMLRGYVPAPHCIYRHVRKLPASALLTLRGHPFDPETRPILYWSIADTALESAASPFRGSEADAAAELECLLSDAIRLRLEADVPLGAFLSGGIDSSTIVALMQRQVAQPVKTFTVGFEESPYNEAEHARRVAQHLGTEHTELYVSPREAMAVIPRLPVLYDEPFADSSQIPTFLISSLARRHVTVSLSGDGGDELLAGYNRYLLTSKTARVALRSPMAVRRLLGGALQTVAPASWDSVAAMVGKLAPSLAAQRHFGDKIHRFAALLTNGRGKGSYEAFMSVWDRPETVVQGATDSRELTARLPPSAQSLDETQQMMLLDVLSYLPDDILVKVDRASMGVSLETRVPFLDQRIAQFCWSLPLAMKVGHGQRKWILRQVLSRHVPRQLVDRPKTGFAVPIGSWLRAPLRHWTESLLDERRLRNDGLLAPHSIRAKWTEHLSSARNWEHQLWAVLMLQAWLDETRKETRQRSPSRP